MATNIAPPPLGVGPVPSAPEGGEVGVIQSGWRLALREFAHNRLALVGLAILVFFVLFSFLGPLFYHGNIYNTSYTGVLPPGPGHPLGTNVQGFDELGLLMNGGQASLEVGFLSAAFGIILGALWGAFAGLVGGMVDSIMMRVVDIFLAIPILFVVLTIAVKWGNTVLSLSLLIGLFSWLAPSRLVRGEVLTLKVRDFVSAARTAGASRTRLISRHLIPNALSVIIVNVTFQVATAILLVATLGFLGVGLHYPTQDWGDLLSNGIQYMSDGYWWLIYPVGACIVLVVMAANLLGDALRDAMDVRLRRR